MVLEYAKYGNLRNYLKTNFSNLKWNEKLSFLYFIAHNLIIIHYRNYIHKDLHSGNILQFNTTYASSKITDLSNKIIQNLLMLQVFAEYFLI